MPIGVVATLKVQDGKNAEFEAVFADLAPKVRANEPGNQYYRVFKSRKDPNTYVVMEAYELPEAIEAHRKSEHFRAAGPKLGPCLAGQPAIEVFDAI